MAPPLTLTAADGAELVRLFNLVLNDPTWTVLPHDLYLEYLHGIGWRCRMAPRGSMEPGTSGEPTQPDVLTALRAAIDPVGADIKPKPSRRRGAKKPPHKKALRRPPGR